MRLILAALALLALGACTAEQQAFVNVGIEQKKAESDTEARIDKAGLCIQTVGAYFRVNTADEQAAIKTLCDPAGRPQGTALTVEQIKAVKEVLSPP